jgi:Skp family chaperone for outer membrane proteins
MFGLLMSIAAVSTSARAADAAAPAASVPHIGVINLRQVIATMQEYKDSQAQLKSMQDDLDASQNAHKAEIENMQRQAKQLKAGSADEEAKMSELDDLSLKSKMDDTKKQVQMVRAQAHELTHAFAEIQAKVAEIAAKRGLDLVLVDSGAEVGPESRDIANPETLTNLILNRNVLFMSDKVNITSEVVTALDADYKNKGAAH